MVRRGADCDTSHVERHQDTERGGGAGVGAGWGGVGSRTGEVGLGPHEWLRGDLSHYIRAPSHHIRLIREGVEWGGAGRGAGRDSFMVVSHCPGCGYTLPGRRTAASRSRLRLQEGD